MPEENTENIETPVTEIVDETPATEVAAEPEVEQPEPEFESQIDLETQQAVEFYAALKDPERAPAIVKELARQAGLIDATPQEQKQIQKTAKDIVKKHLGDGYEFISDKLANAIDEILTERVDARFVETQRQTQAERTAATFDNFYTANKVTDAEAGEMLELAGTMAPNPGVPFDKYLNGLLKLARTELGEKATRVEKVQRIKQNQSKAPTSTRDGATEPRRSETPKEFNLSDAVNAAAKGIRWND